MQVLVAGHFTHLPARIAGPRDKRDPLTGVSAPACRQTGHPLPFAARAKCLAAPAESTLPNTYAPQPSTGRAPARCSRSHICSLHLHSLRHSTPAARTPRAAHTLSACYLLSVHLPLAYAPRAHRHAARSLAIFVRTRKIPNTSFCQDWELLF